MNYLYHNRTQFLILAVLAIFFWSRTLFGDVILWVGDISRQYFPWYLTLYQHLHKHTLPFWIPEMGGGYPLLAQGEVGVFYPVNWVLIFLFPLVTGFSLYLPIHFFLASVGMYGFMRKLVPSRFAALFSGIAFAYSFFFTARTIHITIIAVSSFLPFGLWVIEKSLQEKKERLMIFIGFFVFLQLVAGHPQITFISLITYATYAVLRLLVEKMTLVQKGRFFLWLLIGMLLGIGLAGVQVLPTLELAYYSSRVTQGSDFIFSYSLPQSQYLTYFFPYLFGISPLNTNTGFTQFGGHYWEFALYIGILPFVFALVGLLSVNKNKVARISAVCFFIFAILAIGGYLAPYRFLVRFFHLPFRVSARFLLPTTLFITSLSGIGCNEIVLWKISQKKIAFLIAGSVAVSSVFLLITIHVLHFSIIPSAILSVLKQGFQKTLFTQFQTISLERFTLNNSDIRTSIIFLLVSVVTLVGFYRRIISKNSFLLLAFGTILTDLFLQGYLYQQLTSRKQAFAPPSFLETVTQNKKLSRMGTFTEPGFLMLEKSTLQPNLNMLWNISSINSVTPLPLVGHEHYYSAVLRNFQMMDIGNVSYVISQKPLNNKQLALVSKTDYSFVYKNTAAFPHEYFVSNYEIAHTNDEVFSLLLANKDRFPSEVILEKPISLPQGHTVSKSNFQIQKVILEEEKKVMQTVSKQDGILVVLDSFYPSWEARIDDKKTEILRANGIFQAILVPQGTHTIVFSYVPRMFWYGLGISTFSFIVSTVLSIKRLNKSQK